MKYDNIIKSKSELLKQLNSLKADAIETMRSMPTDDLKEVFQKDLHALRIVIRMVKEDVNQ